MLKAAEESRVKVLHDKLAPEELCTVVWKNLKRLWGKMFVETNKQGKVESVKTLNIIYNKLVLLSNHCLGNLVASIKNCKVAANKDIFSYFL